VFVGYEIGDLAKLVEQLDMEKEQYDAQVQWHVTTDRTCDIA
jgi:hypothetical protein